MRQPTLREPLLAGVKRAIELARNPSASDRTSGAGRTFTSPAPPSVITTQGDDGGTVYPALWDEDTFDDGHAVWS